MDTPLTQQIMIHIDTSYHRVFTPITLISFIDLHNNRASSSRTGQKVGKSRNFHQKVGKVGIFFAKK